MSLYLKLKEIREKKGISQEELAEKLGISRIMIIHYEKGRNYPSLERAVQISSILGCTLDELVIYEKAHNEYSNKLAKVVGKGKNNERK